MPYQQLILATSVFAGLLIPPLAELFSDLLFPSLFGVMLFSLLALNPRNTLALPWPDWRLALVIAAVQMFLIPIAASILASAFVTGPALEIIVLVCAASSIFGAPAFAYLLGLPQKLTLAGVVVSTLLLPLSLPFAWWLTGMHEQNLDLGTYLERVGVYLVTPILIALSYHRLVLQTRYLVSAKLFGYGTITCLAIFAIAVMDGVTITFLDHPWLAVTLVSGALVLHGLLFLLGWSVFFATKNSVAGVAGLLSANRNIGLLAAISGTFIPDYFMLFVAVWQIPMYIAPLAAHLFFTRQSSI